jgi:hypothetical protein
MRTVSGLLFALFSLASLLALAVVASNLFAPHDAKYQNPLLLTGIVMAMSSLACGMTSYQLLKRAATPPWALPFGLIGAILAGAVVFFIVFMQH